MAVSRDGIPVRVWCWPGSTSDSTLIRQVRDELRDWTLGKVIWVADRGFTSGPRNGHTDRHHKIDTRRRKPRLTCTNSGGGAPGARVELRGFEPLTP
jgi:hypothetical protein